MTKKELSPFDKQLLQRIAEDHEFAKAFFEELLERPLPVQLGFLRRMRGVSQEVLAGQLQVDQSYVSKLEREGSDHLLSIYEKLGKFLRARLAFVPIGARIVWPKGRSPLQNAA